MCKHMGKHIRVRAQLDNKECSSSKEARSSFFYTTCLHRVISASPTYSSTAGSTALRRRYMGRSLPFLQVHSPLSICSYVGPHSSISLNTNLALINIFLSLAIVRWCFTTPPITMFSFSLLHLNTHSMASSSYLPRPQSTVGLQTLKR